MSDKKTLLLGASPNPGRYAFKAANKLVEADYPIVLLGIKKGKVAGEEIKTSSDGIRDIHTVSLYLSQENQVFHEEFLLDLKPERVIFNPGAENPDLMKKLNEMGVDAFEACTLVMLSTGQF